jgi:hypothetical protein
MVRYFFDISDGHFLRDETGTELPDLGAARRIAVDIIAELLKGRGDQFWKGDEWELHCREAHDTRLFSLTFMGADAPALTGPTRSPDPAKRSV